MAAPPRDTFLAVCLNPTVQKTLVFHNFQRGEVNRAMDQHTDASGKGVNVSRVLQQAGAAEVVHLTHTSADGLDGFEAMCAADGVRVVGVKAPIRVRTCTTIVNRGAEPDVTELVEEGAAVPDATVAEVLAALEHLLPRVHTVVCSGSTARGFPDGIFAEVTRRAKDPAAGGAAGVRVILDIRKAPLLKALAHRPDFVKVNIQEFLDTFAPEHAAGFSEGAPLTDAVRQTIARHAAELAAEHGTRTILTHGARGVVTVAAGACTVHPAPTVDGGVLNSIGCGDAFAAGLALHLHRDPDDVDAAVDYAQTLAARNAAILRPGRILP